MYVFVIAKGVTVMAIAIKVLTLPKTPALIQFIKTLFQMKRKNHLSTPDTSYSNINRLPTP